MDSAGQAARRSGHNELQRDFVDAHQHTWYRLADFEPAQWHVPHNPGINPPLWEYAHIAWFTELWVLRGAQWSSDGGELLTPRASFLAGADEWFDSSRVAHATRWSLPLPSTGRIRDYVRQVLDGVCEHLAAVHDSDEALYPFRLALFHEDMHGEALTYLRQTLDYGALAGCELPRLDGAGEIDIPAVSFVQGSTPNAGFVFDNEKWAHEVRLAPYQIDRRCVNYREYARFVDAGGYSDERWWSKEGRVWLQAAHPDGPKRWRRSAGGGYEELWFGQWRALPVDTPMCHVNAFEAEAYCRWVGRRLPLESEWEYAAAHGLISWGGSVWEWMANPFAPYVGFTADRYRDYSAPWFHTHRSVRGHSFATRARLQHARYRNFYLPHRTDLFIGFRTCAA